MKFSLLVLLIFIGGISKATNFYVDPSSSASTQNGTLATPWKTLSQVQSNMNLFNPGDFIFFKKGQIFTGNLDIKRSGTAAAPLTFTSYGTGTDMPVFTGATSAKILISYQKYVVVDGIKIMDLNMDPNDHSAQANIKLGFYVDGSSYTTIRNCDISLVGGGINIQGNNNTVDRTTIQNMRMIVNTPGGDDDYGAIPIIISGSNNNITNNFFKDGYAESYDYNYDGGAIEVYGVLNSNNKIMYNTAVNCDGFMEIGYNNGGNSDSNLVAYNKIINCGELVYISNSGSWATSVVNLKFFNNVIVSTENLLRMPNTMIGMSSSSGVANMINLKNNIFWLTTGIDVASPGKFTGTQMTHEDNIYHLGPNSVLNYTAKSSELTTLAALFTSTVSSDPVLWDYHPLSASPAIDFGQNLGLARDFAGNTVPTVPNAGILESLGSQPILTVTPTVGTISCNGGTTTVTIAASGGTAPYTGTGTFTVSAGNYSYTVTDASGTIKTTSVSVTEPTAISVSAVPGSILIFGGTTSITVTATGGTSPYTYSVNAGLFQFSNIFTAVLAGTQIITVKDSKGCTAVKTISITQPGAPTQLTANSTAGIISCNGGSTTVTVTAVGGTAPYTGTGNFTKTAGSYSFTITDASGSIKTTNITITQPALLIAAATAGTITIPGGVTSITSSATGGTGAYTFSLDNGSFQSGGSFSNVAAGTHTIIVKDANGCTSSKTLTIAQPSSLVITASVGTISCNGGTATVTIGATGGTTPYTGTGSFSKAAGTYTFSVTDAAGTVKTTSVTISQPTLITAAVDAPGVYTASAKTTATVTAAGGTPGYTYSLDNGTYKSANVFTNVAVGTHSMKVKDSRGCIKTLSFTVALLSSTPLAISSTSGFISCYGSSAIITITATGGVSPYTGTGAFTKFAGTYSFTVVDASGATVTKTVTLVQPYLIKPVITTGSIIVFGGSTTATITATGGTGALSYKLNNGNYQTSNIFSNIIAGTYTLTVKDARGCSVVKDFTVTQPAAGFHITLVSTTGLTCSGSNNGSIKVAGVSGTSPYKYKKGNGSYSLTSTFNNLAAGNYTITCKDATGATSSMLVNVAGSQTACRTTGKGTATPDTPEAKKDEALPVNGLEVIAFPNPSNSQFSLIAKSNSEEIIHFTVMNMNGQKVYENNSIRNNRSIFGSSFVAGIYFVKVIQGSSVQVIKLIKTK